MIAEQRRELRAPAAASDFGMHKVSDRVAEGAAATVYLGLHLSGRGYLAIAERLTAEGIATPSGHDRDRNRHRHDLAWGKSAIRAILTNPRYTGYQVWAKQRREEILLDVEDVSAGHQTVMRWNGEEQWVWSAEPSHEALVPMESFRAVQARMVETRRGGKARRGPKTNRPYLLRGRLKCGLCGRKLQGSAGTTVSPTTGAPTAPSSRSARLDHPKVVYLRERDLLPHVDTWLGRIFEPARIDETCEAMVRGVDADASTTGRAAANAPSVSATGRSTGTDTFSRPARMRL